MDQQDMRIMLYLSSLQGLNLSMLAKVVYSFLCFAKGKNDFSWWSVKRMCAVFECSHSRFYRTLDELKKAGLIRRESGGGGRGGRGKASHYFVNDLQKVRTTDTFKQQKVRTTDTFKQQKVRTTDTFKQQKVRVLGQKGSQKRNLI